MRHALLALALAPVAVAQPPGRVQVEVTQEVRVPADACRLDFSVVARDADAGVAVDQSAAELKRVREAFAALKLDGVTLTPLPLVLTRSEQTGPGGVPGDVTFTASRPVRVTVAAADYDALTALVTKVENGLFDIGVKGVRKGTPERPGYYRKGVWGEVDAAITTAARRGRAKAEGLAATAGVTLGPAASAEVVNYISPANPTAPVIENTEVGADGQWVLRLRVRLTYHIGK